MEAAVLNSESIIRPTQLARVPIDVGEIGEQIKTVLDGRSQRWLALRIMMPEADLSRKMKGKVSFALEEIKNIARALNVEFIIGPDGRPPAI